MVDTTNPVQDRDNTEDATGNFVELFKKSFTSYVENGMRQLVEKDIDLLRNEEGGFSVTKDFKAKFYKFIVDHYLRKFQLLHLTQWSNHCLYLNTARPWESQAPGTADSEESDGGTFWTSGTPHRTRALGGQTLELERKNEKKFMTWLQKLMPKFHRSWMLNKDIIIINRLLKLHFYCWQNTDNSACTLSQNYWSTKSSACTCVILLRFGYTTHTCLVFLLSSKTLSDQKQLHT